MALLRIGVVEHGGRLGERAEATWREALEAEHELAGVEDLLHEQRLNQRRRQEVIERWLVGKRCLAIGTVPAARRLSDLELERRIVRRARVVEREQAREGT